MCLFLGTRKETDNKMKKRDIAKLECLREMAIAHDSLEAQSDVLSVKMRELKREIRAAMTELDINTIDVDCPEDEKAAIRVSTYQSVRITYDLNKLKAYLKKNNLVKKVCKLVIDESKLEACHKAGLIPLDVIKDASSKKINEVFKIFRVKRK